MSDLETRLALEREYHESEDFLRDRSRLIVGLYHSGVFAKAETHHLYAVGDIAGAEVLDYGCGTGESMRHLLERGANVTGFDISLPRLKAAEDSLQRATGGSRSRLVQCAAEKLPFERETFDFVIGKQILHHLNIDLAAEEIHRVLKPGGKAAFLEPLIHNPFLEGYRRLTPHLRSPTERALSMDDLRRIGDRFGRWEHKEFCFLSVLPAIGAAVTRPNRVWTRMQKLLAEVDEGVVRLFPAVGRYYWETVIVLER